MKTFLKILKWTGIVLGSLIIIFVILVYARANRTFDAPYPEIAASTDSTIIARGKYLVNGPAHCINCHASPDDALKVEAGEIVAPVGGFHFALPIGNIYTPNITSDKETGIGNYSDKEIARALRWGVKKDGRALMDFMPFYHVSEYDLIAIISYLRTIPPVKHQVTSNEYNFLGKAVLAFLIKPMGDGVVPPTPVIDSTAEYGKYLAMNVANCRGCHTKRDMMTGAYIGPDFAGGLPFAVFDYKTMRDKTDEYLVSQNLTPDNETGRLAGWNEQSFLNRFHQGRTISGSPMPWGPFSRLSDLEIKALYKFLQTVTPVKNSVPLGVQQGAVPQ